MLYISKCVLIVFIFFFRNLLYIIAIFDTIVFYYLKKYTRYDHELESIYNQMKLYTIIKYHKYGSNARQKLCK